MPQALPSLTPAERRVLKARSHSLHPVVIVGSKGLTESVFKEVEVALKSHELIKVKLASDDRNERNEQFAILRDAVDAKPVQLIGKIVVLYRKADESPQEPPKPVGKSAARRRPVLSSSPSRRHPTPSAAMGRRPRSDGAPGAERRAKPGARRPASQGPVPRRRPRG
jgi:RNA-binding protein